MSRAGAAQSVGRAVVVTALAAWASVARAADPLLVGIAEDAVVTRGPEVWVVEVAGRVQTVPAPHTPEEIETFRALVFSLAQGLDRPLGPALPPPALPPAVPLPAPPPSSADAPPPSSADAPPVAPEPVEAPNEPAPPAERAPPAPAADPSPDPAAASEPRPTGAEGARASQGRAAGPPASGWIGASASVRPSWRVGAGASVGARLGESRGVGLVASAVVPRRTSFGPQARVGEVGARVEAWATLGAVALAAGGGASIRRWTQRGELVAITPMPAATLSVALPILDGHAAAAAGASVDLGTTTVADAPLAPISGWFELRAVAR